MYGYTPAEHSVALEHRVTCFCRSIAIEIGRRTRRSLKGARSRASASPNGARVFLTPCTTEDGLLLRIASASDRLATQRMSLCPVRKAASRVAESGADRMTYS